MAHPRGEDRLECPTGTNAYTTGRVVKPTSEQQGDAREANSERKPSPKTMIVLLGLTGAGMSTFASLASGRDDLEIGHGVKSCKFIIPRGGTSELTLISPGTQKPQAVEFVLDRRAVVLIHTPALDDDKRSDLRTLEDIAQWMARKGYAKDGQKPDGLIFLHPITSKGAGASEWNRTRLLEKIIGPNFCRRVVIATTMWGELVTTIHGTLENRLQGRLSKGRVWHGMYRQGAKMEKHDNTVESAHAIIRAIISIVDKDGRVDSLLHTEMQENQGRVAHTLVGKELERQIQDKITFMQKELDIHLEERPPSAFRVSKDPNQRRDWRRWQKEHQDMEVELILKQQELKKRRNICCELLFRDFDSSRARIASASHHRQDSPSYCFFHSHQSAHIQPCSTHSTAGTRGQGGWSRTDWMQGGVFVYK